MSNEVKLDAFDIKILAALQKDAKMTKGELADMVGLSISPCWNRVRRLEEAGVIRGYFADVDVQRINNYSTHFVDVHLESHRKEDIKKFKEAMAKLDAVMEVYVLTGAMGFLIKIAVKSKEDYDHFIHDLLLGGDCGAVRANGSMILAQENHYHHASVNLLARDD